jgi:hypothetical protein
MAVRNKSAFQVSVLALVLGMSGGAVRAATATIYGPSAYVSQADAPFHPGDFTGYFYLEDVEDELINTPGLGVTGPGLCIAGKTPGCFPAAGGLTDSVGNGGDGHLGRSIWTAGSTTVTFDKTALGGHLPTFAGLVWTDGVDPINFYVYDEFGTLIGSSLNNHHADGSFFGTLADDRFYGATFSGGIGKLVITDSPGQEIDHIQYGFSPTRGVPEPATWVMMLAGVFGVGGLLRRRRLATA